LEYLVSISGVIIRHLGPHDFIAAFNTAIKKGYINIVKYIASIYVGINLENNGALYFALEFGQLACLKYLVSHGADIRTCADYALTIATHEGYLSIVKYVISLGVKADCVECYDGDMIFGMLSYGDGEIFNIWMETFYYLMDKGGLITELTGKSYVFATIYKRNIPIRRNRAIKRIYYWWIRRCYGMSHPSGIRMAYRNLTEFEGMCLG
jgi:hypothetical protein